MDCDYGRTCEQVKESYEEKVNVIKEKCATSGSDEREDALSQIEEVGADIGQIVNWLNQWSSVMMVLLNLGY